MTDRTTIQAALQQLADDMALLEARHRKGQDSTVWVCQLCGEHRRTTETYAAMLAHLQEAHQVDAALVQRTTGALRQHLNGITYSQRDDTFTLPDGRELLIRSSRTMRTTPRR